MHKKNILLGFTLAELMVVMLIIGLGLMTITPKLTKTSVGSDERLVFFDKLISDHLKRSQELGRPIYFRGFNNTGNITTHDGKNLPIPNTKSIKKSKVNNYETMGGQYAVRVYPDGLCDYFEITFEDGTVIESIPLLMKAQIRQEKNEI